MKTFLTYFLSLTVTFVIGFTVNSFNTNTIAENEVLKSLNDTNKAIINNDQRFLREIYADEVLTPQYNRKISKDQLLKFIDSFDSQLKSIWNFFVSVEIEEEKAKVSYWSYQRFIPNDGSPFDFFGEYTVGLEKQNGKWKIVSIYIERF